MTARAFVVVSLEIELPTRWRPDTSVGDVEKQATAGAVEVLSNILTLYRQNAIGPCAVKVVSPLSVRCVSFDPAKGDGVHD
jgi:hypothetical protein